MEFLIITGMSGAGKSKAVSIFEDLGFYCVDNMPVELIPKFAQICLNAEYDKVALVMDIRANKGFNKLFAYIEEAEQFGCKFKILFLDSDDTVLINRYKETRRKHPVASGNITLTQAIESEREKIEPIRLNADYIIDTSNLLTSSLRSKILEIFADKVSKTLVVNVMSFGFKYGSPQEADLVFDVRFLRNPYYDKELREKTGIQKEVSDYVFENGVADIFMDKLFDMIDFLIPKYIEEGKPSLAIAIGCTGGKHRSVAVSQKLQKHILQSGYNANISHRDIGKV